MSLRLLLLSTDAALPSRCLQVAGNGLVLGSMEVTPTQPLPRTFAAEATRNLVVVPGNEVRALWLDLPAHNPVQALAAAQVLLEEHLAGPREGLHIAIASRQRSGARLVAVVERARVMEWTQRAAALGMVADAMVPDHLVLSAEDGTGDDTRAGGSAATVVCSLDGRWIVRGSALAFTAEPGLALQVLGERPHQVIEDRSQVDALMALGSGQVPIDLLQYEFARQDSSRVETSNRRRLAMLALALLLSPVVLVLAESVRYDSARRDLVRQAASIAAPLVSNVGGDPVAALRARQRELEVPQVMENLRRSLFDSVAATPGTRLDAFEYVDVAASATVVHVTPAQVQDLRAALEQRGIRAQDAGSRSSADGLRTQLTLEPAP